MFPQSFTARVPQRLVVWGALLGILAGLFAATEIIQSWQTASLADERRNVTATAFAHLSTPGSKSSADHDARSKELVEELAAIGAREAYLSSNHRQNKILLVLLGLFTVAWMAWLEFRWTVRPLVHMARVIRSDGAARGEFRGYAVRRDEIGMFAHALTRHFDLVDRQQDAAAAEQERLTRRLAGEEAMRRKSRDFQERIGEIVRHLEENAARMSGASSNLASVSREADQRAGVSVQSTERVSGHVDVVASSIRDIASTLTAAAADADRTSGVAATALDAVAAAKDDANALAEAARTIEQVMELIEDVAEQTNLLALNATIEAARAGEMGRGFGVVAHEVKQLATRTSKATEDVREGLQGIKAASVRIAARTSKLVESIEIVSDVSGAIAQSIRTQDDNSQAISTTTLKTAAEVRGMASAVKDVAGMIGEAKQAAELLTGVSADLGRQAGELRAAMERFVSSTDRGAA